MSDTTNQPAIEEERTQGTAFAVLLEEFQDVRSRLKSDDPGADILTEDLLRDVFLSAWRHQFDDDRSEFRARLREIVGDAVQQHGLE